MKNKIFKSLAVSLWCLCLSFLLPCGGCFFTPISAVDVPNADVTYDSDNRWEGTLTIDQNSTVKLSGVEYSTSGTDTSPIAVRGNSTVNLIFEGNNVLTGNPDVISAGIEVENGSTVNIYGLEGSSLTVTGGKYGAGIGGIGYGSASTENPSCGNINIYSGNITAIGGARGAGIGSGYHSSASDINIQGGNITAFGSECGAGIGTGYGTSGGAAVNNSGNPTGSGVGFYNGGNITISGGTVRAASYHINFNNLDPYNTETLYGEGYSDSFAAGIGGGYGASSGNIVIEGDADVIALGACGGAGIGSGRGTSKAANYDSDNFDVSVTIRGNSNVVAMATNDTRTNIVGDDGGAAIGLGRGCTVENEPKGSVNIEGNARVYAVAPDHAQAIGGSCVVGKFTQTDGVIVRPANASLNEISIGNSAHVTAVSDGNRGAIQFNDVAALKDFISLNFDENYFANHSDFFTQDKFPVVIEASDAENANLKTTFAVQDNVGMNCMTHVSGAGTYNLLVKDYQGANGESVFLSNLVESNSARFVSDATALREYGVAGLTSNFAGTGNLTLDNGSVSVRAEAEKGVFEYGSTLQCAKINDQSVIDSLNANMDQQYADTLGNVIYFDLGVNNKSGESYSNVTDGSMKVYVEIPENWNSERVMPLFVTADEDETFSDSKQIETIDGVTYVSFRTNHFGNYALFESAEQQHGDDNNGQQGENNNQENNGENGSGQSENNNEGGNQSIENDMQQLEQMMQNMLNNLQRLLNRMWWSIIIIPFGRW